MNLSSRHQQRGQGMTEYIIIVALIAVAAIGVYQFFGQTIRNQTAGIANEVAGQDAQAQIQQAQQAAQGATNEGQATKGLATYNNNTNANR
jgi:Flp pilus assembly pilin Flp